MKTFSEDSRVKIPTLLHLTRLGYRYLSLKSAQWDAATNIFPDLFHQAIAKLNPDASEGDISRELQDLSLTLLNKDLGKAFYQRITQTTGLRLIDFENFDNNSFHVVTELPYKNEEDVFRPDITLLINGLPLVFIEVKKPNNPDGIRAEHKRLEDRFQNPKFHRFLNATQLMLFSNNMEYDDAAIEPLQGAFYAAASYGRPVFNFFREERPDELADALAPLDTDVETFILTDTNLKHIRHLPEYATNCSPHRPTNRLCTSLLSRPRLAFLLRYAFAYLHTGQKVEKHIMRYPQIFATMAIARTLDSGTRSGIIWHTQGSGKTALAYYNVRHLTNHYCRQGIVPKFYFIVDRIDLLIQASSEFRARGLVVHTIDSREAFVHDIKSPQAVHNDSGEAEITVVNIQKFKDDPDAVQPQDYALALQRIYFLDEVHRSYNPTGSFLANLKQSDPQAIRIGLTGTPLLGDNPSRALFGDYIHKYYYNSSVKDGYTLRLIREEIATEYSLRLKQVLEEIQVLRGEQNRTQVYAHKSFVKPMLDYIVDDMNQARVIHEAPNMGAMVICDSADQARMMAQLFQETYAGKKNLPHPFAPMPAAKDEYKARPHLTNTILRHALILHDEGTKEERKRWQEDFKEGKIDILFVYQMLLTGFDAPRLKKLYLGRLIRAHNLLQALTRVNRRYQHFRYGYVVDFANILNELEKTNRDYFKELQSEFGDESEHYSSLFLSEEEIRREIDEIKETLFHYNINNAEIFSQQISEIQDAAVLRPLLHALERARELYNLIRTFDYPDLRSQLDFQKINALRIEATNRLHLLHQKDLLEGKAESENLLDIALEDIFFLFKKVGEKEMHIADELYSTLRRTRESLGGNFDPRDPALISLREELERLFKSKKLTELTEEDMAKNITKLNSIYTRAQELNYRNQLLRAKYANDAKYARLHKRILEKGELSVTESKLCEALNGLKTDIDEKFGDNIHLLDNSDYSRQLITRAIIEQVRTQHRVDLSPQIAQFIARTITDEYRQELDDELA